MTDKVREALEAAPTIIGTIGHIDHGKTSLTAAVAKYLATPASAPPAPDGLEPVQTMKLDGIRQAIDLLLDLDQGRSIHNSRFKDSQIDGPLWAQITRVVEKARSNLATLSAQEAEIERMRKEQQAKDAVYWATAEQCANLETDLTQMRKERDEAADSCNNLILELSKSGASLSEENNLRMSAEAEVARLRKVVERSEAERAEQWRLRRDADGSRDVANAVAASLRAENEALRAQLASIRDETLEEAAKAGWNACRRSVYAVCEDVEAEADRIRITASVGTAAEEQHAKGYHAGTCRAAKSIARGFNSMEAEDDDNFTAAIRALQTKEKTNG